MKKLAFALLSLYSITINAQEIKILNTKEYLRNGSKEFILFCELKNNSKETIILPLPVETVGNNNTNSFNYFYLIETFPNNAFIIEESPPAIMTKKAKLTSDSILICKPFSTLKFNFDTKYITKNDVYFDDKIKFKQLALIYRPFDLTDEEKKENLSDELVNSNFYKKKIKSKSFSIKKT